MPTKQNPEVNHCKVASYEIWVGMVDLWPKLPALVAGMTSALKQDFEPAKRRALNAFAICLDFSLYALVKGDAICLDWDSPDGI